MTENEKLDKLWHFTFGNGQHGVDERLRAVEHTSELAESAHDFMLELRVGWRVLKWVFAVALPAVTWFGWYVIQLLQRLQPG